MRKSFDLMQLCAVEKLFNFSSIEWKKANEQQGLNVPVDNVPQKMKFSFKCKKCGKIKPQYFWLFEAKHFVTDTKEVIPEVNERVNRERHSTSWDSNTVPKRKSMVSQALKLVEHFLVPALDNGRYGPLLEWENQQRAIFRIRWTHKARSTWDKTELRVFLDWDEKKGRFPPPELPHAKRKGRPPNCSYYDKYHVNSKQRLRAALRNIKVVKELPCTSMYKRYRILDLDAVRNSEPFEYPPTINSEVPSTAREGINTRLRRKLKIEPKMYACEDTNDSDDPIYERKSKKKQGNRRRKCTRKSIKQEENLPLPSVADEQTTIQDNDTFFEQSTITFRPYNLTNPQDNLPWSLYQEEVTVKTEPPSSHKRSLLDAQPSTSRRIDAHPSTSGRPDVQPSTSRKLYVHPSTSGRPDIQPSTSRRLDVHPSTSRKLYAHPSASGRPNVQPSTSRKMSPKMYATEDTNDSDDPIYEQKSQKRRGNRRHNCTQKSIKQEDKMSVKIEPPSSKKRSLLDVNPSTFRRLDVNPSTSRRPHVQPSTSRRPDDQPSTSRKSPSTTTKIHIKKENKRIPRALAGILDQRERHSTSWDSNTVPKRKSMVFQI